MVGGALISQGVWLEQSDHIPSRDWLFFLASAIFSLHSQTTPSLSVAVELHVYNEWVGGAWQISGCVGSLLGLGRLGDQCRGEGERRLGSS